MTVSHVWSGAVTPESAWVRAKVTGASIQLAVDTNPAFPAPTFFGPVTPSLGIASIQATGLTANTVYHYAIKEDAGALNTTFAGKFKTYPTTGLPASFTFASASCAGGGVGEGDITSQVSNHPVFDDIRTHSTSPLFFAHTGDLHYRDIAAANVALYRTAYDDVLTYNGTQGANARQGLLYRNMPITYAWDDHDFGPNNSDSTSPGRVQAAQAYRERVPHYPLGSSIVNGPVYQSWQIGRVLFILSDVRYDRNPNGDPQSSSKTMLGTAQKTWMQDLLSTSDAAALVWLLPSRWLGTGSDTFASFTHERAELAAMFQDLGWAHRMCVVTGDAHMLAICTGPNNPYGGFPNFVFASLDSDAEEASFPEYDLGVSIGRRQYGTMEIVDNGGDIVITGTGWFGDGVWKSHTFTTSLTPPVTVSPPPLASPEFLDAVTGSHQISVAAQVLEEWAQGAEPSGGTPIKVIDGSVEFDSSADIRATCTLTTDPEAYDIEDLLTPYGNEIFLQRGVVIGPGRVEMHPLGYYRITDVDQENAPFGSVRIEGQDRMSGIVEARLLRPRQFTSSSTLAGVFSNLVREIYPLAEILFDDDTGEHTVGRGAICERDRYDFLRDLAKARGKLMFWDRLGRLRIQSPPDPSTPKWDISYGEKGVLISLNRSRTRGGTYNAVVASGEAGDTDNPVRASAVDNNPNSPTYWYGRYGKVPRFYVSPFITQKIHALNAARSILAAQLGVANNVEFNVVPNPSLDLGDAVRVTHDPRLGTRTHVLDTLTIPLDAKSPVKATTRVYSSQNIELS